MASVANAYVIGNVTRDAEVRDAGPTRVCNLTIAHNTKYKDKETVSYIEAVLFGKLADIAGEYVRKGSLIFIEGELREDRWDDKETGEKRSKLRVIASKMRMVGGGKGERGGRSQNEPESDQGGGSDYAAPEELAGAPF